MRAWWARWTPSRAPRRTPLPPLHPSRPQAASLRRGSNRAKATALTKGLAEALFAHAYPRLDVEVTKKMNHLLKVGGR
jgi:hypothetical protein